MADKVVYVDNKPAKPEAPYLENIETGEIYPWNEHLAKRNDVRPLDKLPSKRGQKKTTPTE